MKDKPAFIYRLAAVLGALCVWQCAAMLFGQRLLLASPLETLRRLIALFGEPDFFVTVWFSFSRIVGGFTAALAAGVLLALAAGRFPVVEVLLRPYMVTIKSVPVASFIIIALIWLSSTGLSVFIAFLMVLPVIYSNVLAGVKNADRRLSEAAAVFHVPFIRRLAYIWLPGVKPHLLSACSTALGLSWKAGVAAEVIGIPAQSIGEALYEAKIYWNTAELFAWTVVIVLISVCFERLFMLLLKAGFARLERI